MLRQIGEADFRAKVRAREKKIVMRTQAFAAARAGREAAQLLESYALSERIEKRLNFFMLGKAVRLI